MAPAFGISRVLKLPLFERDSVFDYGDTFCAITLLLCDVCQDMNVRLLRSPSAQEGVSTTRVCEECRGAMLDVAAMILTHATERRE